MSKKRKIKLSKKRIGIDNKNDIMSKYITKIDEKITAKKIDKVQKFV